MKRNGVTSSDQISKRSGKKRKQFFFIGGAPVFDYIINIKQDEITSGTKNLGVIMDTKLFLPIGTILVGKTCSGEVIALNPFACSEVNEIGGKYFYSLEFGGKQVQHREIILAGDLEQIKQEMLAKFSQTLHSIDDIHVVDVKTPISVSLGGNNKNIIAAMSSIYSSYGIPSSTEDVSTFHLLFFDTHTNLWNHLKKEYEELEVNVGNNQQIHVDKLIARKGYVITTILDNGTKLDRTILSNKTNEGIITSEKLLERYQALEKFLYESSKETDTYLILNSITNPNELRLTFHLLQVAYAMKVRNFFCLNTTFLNCVEELTSGKNYFRRRMLQWFNSGKEIIERRVFPYIECMILNRDELTALEPGIEVKGLERCMLEVAKKMNHGRASFSMSGGKLVVSDGKRGVKFAELLKQDDAEIFWHKCNPGLVEEFKYAERIISTGDDYVKTFINTLGAGDTFTGIFIGLAAQNWDMGHAIRAATLGAQYFIITRKLPFLSDLVSLDQEHCFNGTYGRLSDSLFFHMDGGGVLTRYGAIVEKTNAMHTNQLHRPFSDIVTIYCGKYR